MVTQEMVDSNLGHAKANGYFMDLREWTVSDICIDLLCFADDLVGSDEDTLRPLVQDWYDRHKDDDSGSN